VALVGWWEEVKVACSLYGNIDWPSFIIDLHDFLILNSLSNRRLPRCNVYSFRCPGYGQVAQPMPGLLKIDVQGVTSFYLYETVRYRTKIVRN